MVLSEFKSAGESFGIAEMLCVDQAEYFQEGIINVGRLITTSPRMTDFHRVVMNQIQTQSIVAKSCTESH